MNVEKILSDLEAKHPGEKEYLQAVKEVLLSVKDVYEEHPEFENAKIIERMVEPDRISRSAFFGPTTRVRFRQTSAIACSSTTLPARTREVSVSTLL